MNGNVKLGRAAACSGEWAQHFSNASCYVQASGAVFMEKLLTLKSYCESASHGCSFKTVLT